MSWLRDYLEYTEGQESPERFHLWVGITAIAMALGRNVWIERREKAITYFTTYPGHLQIILIGGSGRVKKNSAINLARPFIDSLGRPILGGKVSPEGFLKQLDPASGGSPDSIVIEPEMVVMISKATYAESFVDILTKLADGDTFPYITNTWGKITIPNPTVTCIFGAVPTGMGHLPQVAQEGGWLSRVIPIYSNKADRIRVLVDVEDEDVTPEEIQNAQRVSAQLKSGYERIKALRGPFTYTKDAKAWMIKYYNNYVNSPDYREGYPTRRTEHMLRVAMCLIASRDNTLVFDQRSLEATDNLLKEVEADFPKALAYVGGSMRSRERERIMDAIAASGGTATSNQIYAAVSKFFSDLDSIRKAMILLQEGGQIECINPSDKSRGIKETWKLIKR